MTAPVGTPGQSGRSVLIVDDEAPVREMFGSMLEDFGFLVLQAADGDEALAACRRHGASLVGVLLDLTMPGTTPDALMNGMRAAVPGLPIIVASGWSEAAARERYARLDCEAYLRKPFGPQTLLETLERAIEGRGRGP